MKHVLAVVMMAFCIQSCSSMGGNMHGLAGQNQQIYGGFAALTVLGLAGHAALQALRDINGGEAGNQLNNAVLAGNSQIVADILRADKTLVRSKTFNGSLTPLHYAAITGRCEIARALIDAGASVNVQTTHYNPVLRGEAVLKGLTPLHYAAENGFQEVVELLLRCGAYVNAQDEIGDTPLHKAVKSGAVEVVRFLCNPRMTFYPNPHLSNKSGQTSLVIACAPRADLAAK